MGRSALLLVIGFSMIFLYRGESLSRASVDAFSNAISYYENSNRHNIAVAAANFACAQFFQDSTWRAGYKNVSYGGGTFNVYAQSVAGTNPQQVKITATGFYQNDSENIIVVLEPSSFAKFAYFSNNEPNNIYWTTGDTVYGPYHSNTSIYVDGSPVFWGKATSNQQWTGKTKSAKPIFNGGYSKGVTIPFNNDLSSVTTAASSGGKVFNTTSNVYFTFNSDGTLTYKVGSAGTSHTISLKDSVPNGVIAVTGGNAYVQGILNGQATVAAIAGSGNTNGQIFLDGNIQYNKDPRYTTSTDMMGLVASNNILISEKKRDGTLNDGDEIVQASIFSKNGGFGAENYDTRADAGYIRLLGGIEMNTRQAVGTYGGYGGSTGFQKSYMYDNRLMSTYPPAFPNTGSFEVLSWFE
jgi:hypothetical protein